MHKILTAIFLLIFVSAKAQDPRKRFLNPYVLDELELNKNEDDVTCGPGLCVKRSSGQDELGPFWANRGKKDPSYMQETFYAEEPYWVFVRQDDQEEPFFTSRGKKEFKTNKYFHNLRLRDRREYSANGESPFFASRGKKLKAKNYKM